jgi:hypothetical protein
MLLTLACIALKNDIHYYLLYILTASLQHGLKYVLTQHIKSSIAKAATAGAQHMDSNCTHM